MIALKVKMNTFIKKLRDRWKISNETYENLRISSAKPGILYGLPKTHKDNIPMRPILSAINTFNYKLAKFLCPILQPIASNQHTIPSTQAFAKEIQTMHFNHPIYLASFDITSLYTNIPVDETIEIALDSLCDHNDKFVNLDRKELKTLLQLATKDNIFYFNETLYKQVDGCAMGSPLSGTIANVFMCHHEVNWLESCPPIFRPVMYKRYADDSFLVFKDQSHVEMFRSFLNAQHPNIHFTLECEVNNSLNFLDMTISHSNGHLTTHTYRKPTHSGLGTHFTSFIPHKFKTNAIQTLLFRAYNTCSSWLTFHTEITFLTQYFQQNGFPTHIIHTFTHRFLNKKLNPKPLPQTVPKEKLYISLPFLGPFSFHIKKLLIKLLSPAYPQLDLQFIFTNKTTIATLFPYKDRIPAQLQSLVVYEYRCHCSVATYVGQTTCNLASRIAGHQGISDRTGVPLASPSFSAIREHSRKRHHAINPDSFKIIDTAKNPLHLDILEALHIKFKRPTLNIQTDTEKLITT